MVNFKKDMSKAHIPKVPWGRRRGFRTKLKLGQQNGHKNKDTITICHKNTRRRYTNNQYLYCRLICSDGPGV